MIFNFLKADVREQKLLSWASLGLLVFLSAFLWAPSRDGLQGIYALSFFIPMMFILLFRKPNFHEYGGWMTVLALAYAGYSTLSTLWGNSKDLGFFILQWCVLATWLCGSCLIFSRHEFDIRKYLSWMIFLGVLIIISTFFYYYRFVDSQLTFVIRLTGWNVFRNPNEIGALSGIIALFALIVAFESRSLKRAWLFYFLAATASLGLIFSFSRGALLAFIIMAFIALLVIRPALKIWLPPMLVVVGSLILLLLFTHISNDFGGRSYSVGDRSVVWLEALSRGREHFLIGIGMTKDTTILVQGFEPFNHAHNAWLDTFYRTGLIGLGLVLMHLGLVLKNFSRKSALVPLYLWLGYGCICNFVDSRCFFWEISAKWFLYWIPAGLITASLTGMLARTNETKLEKNNVISD